MGGLHYRHRRGSIRLQGYDYAQPGAYFVTICTVQRECVLGEISGGSMQLSEAGKLVAEVWATLPIYFSSVRLDAFVIMPNHLHGIICLQGALSPPPEQEAERPPALGQVVRVFKSLSARAANQLTDRGGQPFWQRNYYEHVIRTEASLATIRRYIESNPARWVDDPENPSRDAS
jgi:putative transposase